MGIKDRTTLRFTFIWQHLRSYRALGSGEEDLETMTHRHQQTTRSIFNQRHYRSDRWSICFKEMSYFKKGAFIKMLKVDFKSKLILSLKINDLNRSYKHPNSNSTQTPLRPNCSIIKSFEDRYFSKLSSSLYDLVPFRLALTVCFHSYGSSSLTNSVARTVLWLVTIQFRKPLELAQ